MAPHVYDVDDASIYYVRKFAIASLVANAQYAEAEEQCRHALNTLYSLEFESQHDETSILLERLIITNEQIRNSRGLDRLAEAEEAYMYMQRIESERLSTMSEKRNRDLAWGRSIQMHNIANTIHGQDRIDEARNLNQESLRIAGSIMDTANSQDAAKKERSYMSMLNLKAHIIRRSLRECAFTNEIAGKQSLEAQNIYMLVFQKSFGLFGVTDIDTWKATNNCIGIMLERKEYKAALDVLLQMRHAAKTTDMSFEGQKLETFAITLGMVKSLRFIPSIMRDANMKWEAATIIEFYNGLAKNRAVESVTRFKDPIGLNNDAVSLIRRGHFRQVEEALRELLGRLPPTSMQIEHYNLMLAIARQPGRRTEAYAFREQHLDKVSAAEAKHGHLSSRLQRDEEDLTTYRDAKTKIEHGQLTFGDAWWTEHGEALERAELRYGAPFNDVRYDERTSDVVAEISDQGKLVKKTVPRIEET